MYEAATITTKSKPPSGTALRSLYAMSGTDTSLSYGACDAQYPVLIWVFFFVCAMPCSVLTKGMLLPGDNNSPVWTRAELLDFSIRL
eukprot:2814998-Rhodomonas_salina.4